VIPIFVLFVFCSQAKYNVSDFTLGNGLRVVCIEKKTSPIIFFSIWYRCGSKNDAISKSGVAHYLEHMAFSSNKMEFSNFLEDIGAAKNAFTSLKTICFYEIFSNEHIESVFSHEAIRMVTLAIDDDIFLSEKNAILEERSTRVDNEPEGALQEAALANIFSREIAGIGIIGWKHEIEAITKEDLYDFHNKWFAPNNAIIVISGDFDLDNIKMLAEKYFGNIPSKSIDDNLKENIADPVSCIREIRYSSSKNGEHSSIEYVYRVPFFAKENLRKAIALEVAVMAMNRPAFFVKKMLKDISNCATNVVFEYESRTFPYDIVCLESSAPSIDDLDNAENLWSYLRNKLMCVGITASELDAVKQRYLISLAYEKDDIARMSNHFGWMLIGGYSVDEIQSMDDLIESISLEECNDLLREIFSQKPCAIIRAVPKGYDRE
jgi:zinc protease